MQRTPVSLGVVVSLSLTGAASAQVSILSVARDAHVRVCIHAPNNPNWCEQFDDANTTAGLWGTGGSFGPGSGTDEGHANAAVGAGQQSEVYPDRIIATGNTNCWVESGGTGSTEAVGTTSLVVRFGVGSATSADIDGGFTHIIGTGGLIITRVGGETVFSSDVPVFQATAILTPGEYELRAGSICNSACGGECEHTLLVNWNFNVYFEPVPCAADFNGDGFLDFFDADAYTACFEGAECPPGKTADFNGDEFVDFFDVDAFIAAFEAGC